MSAGNTIIEFSPLCCVPPDFGYARFGVRNDHPVLYFGHTGTVNESGFFSAIMPHYYSGRGMNVNIAWSSSTGSIGYCKWNGALERFTGNSDLKTSHFLGIQSASGEAPASSGLIQYLNLPMTGIYCTGLLPGELFRFMIQRDGTQNSMSGDAELYFLEFKEA